VIIRIHKPPEQIRSLLEFGDIREGDRRLFGVLEKQPATALAPPPELPLLLWRVRALRSSADVSATTPRSARLGVRSSQAVS
jgi:hypothetical protein